ncbi:paraquat-inducible membrane protein A, partial [Myxococcota bacterium]|nr:paraquat-inducible membrane protein A [Myxococcota bacterium]
MNTDSSEVWTCLECSQSSRVTPPARFSRAQVICPRCRAEIHRRKPNSAARTWALLLAAGLLYVPANVFPIL